MKYVKKNTLNFWPVVFIVVLIFLVQKAIPNQAEESKITFLETKTNKESPVYLEVNEEEEEEKIPSENTIFEEGENEENLDFDIHIVKSGENLTSIAKKWGVTITSIQELNEIEDADSIKIGQELKIPLRDQWNSDYPEDDGLYKIKKGDTLDSIARALNTTVPILQELNPGIDPAKLKIGTMINVPSLPEKED